MISIVTLLVTPPTKSPEPSEEEAEGRAGLGCVKPASSGRGSRRNGLYAFHRARRARTSPSHPVSQEDLAKELLEVCRMHPDLSWQQRSSIGQDEMTCASVGTSLRLR